VRKTMILLPLLMLMTSCGLFKVLEPGTEVSKTETGSMTVSTGTAIVELNLPVNITIGQSPTADITWNVKKKVQAASVRRGEKALEEMAFQKTSEGSSDKMTISQPEIDNFYVFKVGIEGTILIPATVTVVRISTTSGEIALNGSGTVFGELNLKTTSGMINLKDFSIADNGKLKLECTSGNLVMDGTRMGNGSQADIDCTSGMADLTMSVMSNTGLDVKITSGMLIFRNSFLKGVLGVFKTTSGSMDLQTSGITGGTSLTANVTSGSLDFSTSTANSIAFDLSTTSGSISVAGKYGFSAHGSSMTHQMNGSANSVTARVTSGSITLK
jgi:DUF4097 and DUF4098 domain-containing protein YvlB